MTFLVDSLATFAAVAISFMLVLILVTPDAAVCMFDDMSRVTAFCSSTAAAMLPEMSLILLMVAVISWIALAASPVTP